MNYDGYLLDDEGYVAIVFVRNKKRKKSSTNVITDEADDDLDLFYRQWLIV